VVNLIQTSVVDRRTLVAIELPSQSGADGRTRIAPMAKKIKKSKVAAIKAAIQAAKKAAKKAKKSDTEVDRPSVPLNSPFSS
jgi:hypothetical protein